MHSAVQNKTAALFYRAHQLYCQSDMTTNRHDCVLDHLPARTVFRTLHTGEVWNSKLLKSSSFLFPFPPQLCYSTSLLFTSQRLQVSKCQISEEDFLMPCQLYMPFLSVVFHILEIICLLELCALLAPLIFF